MPHFEYLGIVGMMAAFKHYVGYSFWKGKLLSDPHGLLKGGGGMSPLGSKLKSVTELPDDEILLEYIREAIALNENGVALPKPGRKKLPKPKIPADLQTALATNKKACETFENFPPSHQRDYIEWLTEAKQDATRQRRLATTLEWLTEGKPRNWKYMKKELGEQR